MVEVFATHTARNMLEEEPGYNAGSTYRLAVSDLGLFGLKVQKVYPGRGMFSSVSVCWYRNWGQFLRRWSVRRWLTKDKEGKVIEENPYLEFEMYLDKKNEWRWKLRAPNRKIIADSAEGYKKKIDCTDAIALLQRHSASAVIKRPTSVTNG